MRIFGLLIFAVVLALLFWFQIDPKILVYLHTAAAAAIFFAYVGHVWSSEDDEDR